MPSADPTSRGQPRSDDLRVVRGGELSGATAQTAGMTRQEAISGRTAGASKLWMGRALAPAGVVSAAHHHGESESAIYVASGHPSFLFGEGLRQRVDVGPGDFIFVAPFAPHIAEELWEHFGHESGVFESRWPSYDPALATVDEIELVVQVNGKVRGKIRVARDIAQERAVSLARADAGIARFLDGEPKKIIFVPGRLLNIVV